MQFFPVFLVFFLAFLAPQCVLADCTACVNLDEYSFAKIVPKFEAVLVKFDVQYPYGPKHEAFEEIAEEMKKLDKLLVAQVGVKDYGERDNEAFALTHGINATNDIPALKLYVRNKKPVDFPKTADWTAENIRKLLSEFTTLYIGLPGCFERLDRIAVRFVGAADKQRELEALEREIKSAGTTAEEQESGKIYANVMRKVIADGVDFIGKENARLGKILKGSKLKEEKVKEMKKKLNILRSFTLPRDEL